MPSILARVVRKILSRKERGPSLDIRVPEGTPVNIECPATGPPVPQLPKERPRIITPRPSNEDLCRSAAASTADCAFFQKLPYEIRRQILIEAFGGHTVHMDLWFDHPEAPLETFEHKGRTYTRPFFSHCGRNRIEAPGTGPFVRVDETKPKRWIWRSSECHRDSPDHFQKGVKGPLDGKVLNPAEDCCRYGGASLNNCAKWPGDKPTKCFIGAMGWLLSCRQAYVEGIDILYATNIIHTASKQMLLNLDGLLLPQRLSTIRSVELVWKFTPFPYSPRDEPEPYTDFRSFYKFLDAVPKLFPNIRSLYLAIQGGLTVWCNQGGLGSYFMKDDVQLRLTETYIMAPIDNMLRKLGPQARDCNIAVSSTLYQRQRDQALKAGVATVDRIECGAKQERYWRQMSSSKRGARAGEQLEGYWVYLGSRERVRMIVCTMAQGGDPFGENNRAWHVFHTPDQLLDPH